MSNCFCSGPDHTGKCACQRGNSFFEELETQLEDTTESLSITKALYVEVLKQNIKLEEKLKEAINIASLALDALHEVQTYDQPHDPWTENALTMHELNAFDFNVEAARTNIAELEEKLKEARRYWYNQGYFDAFMQINEEKNDE